MKPMDVILTNNAVLAGTDQEHNVRMEHTYKPNRGTRFLCLLLGTVTYKMGGKLPDLEKMALARLAQYHWVQVDNPLDEEPWDLPEEVEDKVGLMADLGRVARMHQASPDNVLTQELLDALNAHGYLVVKDPLRTKIDNRISQLEEV